MNPCSQAVWMKCRRCESDPNFDLPGESDMKDETFRSAEDVPTGEYIDDEFCASYRKDAENGDPEAQLKLSLYTATSFDNEESANCAESLNWLRKAAEQGYSPAQYQLGLLYLLGRKLPMDEVQALDWFRKADQSGSNPDAQYAISQMYGMGVGVPKNETMRVAWLCKAAESGHAEAQYYLGSLYDRGLGGLPKDGSKALALYRQSAAQEHPYGEFTLGLLYEHGRGVSKDVEEAIRWYRRAAEHGEEAAHEKLCEMGLDSHQATSI